MTHDKRIGVNEALNLQYMNKENVIKLKILLLGFNFKMMAPEV